MKNNIEKLSESSGLELEKAKRIWVEFEGFFSEAEHCAALVNGLEITSVDQKEDMALARKTRLALKRVRVDANKTKKQLKEGVLQEGRFIDQTYKLISDATTPIEEHLSELENFAKRAEEDRRTKLLAERIAAFAAYGGAPAYLDLSEMSAENFDALLNDARTAHEGKLEAERLAAAELKAAEEAAAKERAEREAREAALQAQLAEQQRIAEEERVKIEAARQEAAAEARREREARAAIEQRERERIEAELADQRAAQIQLERELAEARAAALAEMQRIEAERIRLEKAGDKERLINYWNQIKSVEVPTVSSDEALHIVVKIRDFIQSTEIEIGGLTND